MDASGERTAFLNGIDRACSEMGAKDMSAPLRKFACISGAFELDPISFVRGFDGIVKRAYDEDRRGMFRRLLPWLLVPAAVYGAAKFGDMWGRHAYANDNDRGPVAGPLTSLMEHLSGGRLQYVGRRTAKTLAADWRSRPMTALQHERLHRTGSTIDPEEFG